jgi:TPP-dependent trihydroxycyclohexane-1,2-dione (THcHDO) dehydratase
MKFPYLEFEGKYLPIVPIKIKGREWVEFQAFVDTGAGYSIFMYDIADVLGIDAEKGKKEFVKIGDGSFIEVFTFKLRVMFAGKEFNAKIGFSRGLGVGFNIIGRQDIFDNFKVCFDESEKTVEFVPK